MRVSADLPITPTAQLIADLKSELAFWKNEAEFKAEIVKALLPYQDDAVRYRWLRKQHELLDPRAAVVWKQSHGQFNEVQWVNTSGPEGLDAGIDAAIATERKQA